MEGLSSKSQVLSPSTTRLSSGTGGFYRVMPVEAGQSNHGPGPPVEGPGKCTKKAGFQREADREQIRVVFKKRFILAF